MWSRGIDAYDVHSENKEKLISLKTMEDGQVMLYSLQNPRMDIQTSEELLFAIRLLVTQDPSSGRFVFGRQQLQPKKSKSMLPSNSGGGGDNSKSKLQTLLTRAGHDTPCYKTKQMRANQFRSTVEFNEMQFVGQPCSNKKLAEKDAAAEALEWLMGGDSSGSRGIDHMSTRRARSIIIEGHECRAFIFQTTRRL